MYKKDFILSLVRNEQHFNFIEQCIVKLDDYPFKSEYIPLFFTLGLIDNIDNKIDMLFDFENRLLKYNANISWASSNDIRIMALAFNLFTYDTNFKNNYLNYNLADIFNVNDDLKELMINALRIYNRL